MATWLGSIPSALLLFIGYPLHPPSVPYCILQALLIDGGLPMQGVAGLCLVLKTLLQVRAQLLGRDQNFMEIKWQRILALSLPYLTFLCWSSASLIATELSLSHPSFDLSISLVFCSVHSTSNARVRRFIGFFMIGFSLLELVMEGWIIFLALQSKRTFIISNKNELSSSQMSLVIRVFIFTFTQFGTFILSLLLSAVQISAETNLRFGNLMRLIETLNGLFTFCVFGTSNSLLRVWRLKRGTSTQSDFREVEREWDCNIHINSVPEMEDVPSISVACTL